MTSPSADRPGATDPAVDRELEIQRFLTSIAVDLMRTPPAQIDASIAETLRYAGRFLGGEQVHLRLIGEDETGVSISVCSDPTAPSPTAPDWLPSWNHGDWWSEQLAETGLIVIPDTTRIDDQPVRRGIAGAGIGAVIVLQIRDDDGVQGGIAVQSAEPQPSWTHDGVKPMAALAELVQGAVQRRISKNALVAARDAAERANQAKTEFLANMSHELRTPMNAILGFAQLLNESKTVNTNDRDCVSEILLAGEHLLKLINEVLDLAKIEAGRADLKLEQVDAGPVAEDCVKLVSPLAAIRDISLELSVHDRLPVLADRSRLRQSLLNLLSNAIKYNRDGGCVRINVKRQGSGHLRLAVSDDGLGISEQQISRLFEPFRRLPANADTTEGTGIGLTITKQLIDLMGGRIEVDSALGRGSTFSIVLPLATSGALEGVHPTSPQPRPVDAEPVADNRQRVLYIEDEPANRRLVQQLFNRPDCPDLTTEGTVADGLRAARENPPQLMLVDVSLPDGDGYEVLRKVRADRVLRHIPVIAVTAHAMPGDAERGIAAGFDDYVTKPIDLDALAVTVGRWLSTADETVRRLEEAVAE